MNCSAGRLVKITFVIVQQEPPTKGRWLMSLDFEPGNGQARSNAVSSLPVEATYLQLPRIIVIVLQGDAAKLVDIRVVKCVWIQPEVGRSAVPIVHGK
jgi:hypothetical protein